MKIICVKDEVNEGEFYICCYAEAKYSADEAHEFICKFEAEPCETPSEEEISLISDLSPIEVGDKFWCNGFGWMIRIK